MIVNVLTLLVLTSYSMHTADNNNKVVSTSGFQKKCPDLNADQEMHRPRSLMISPSYSPVPSADANTQTIIIIDNLLQRTNLTTEAVRYGVGEFRSFPWPPTYLSTNGMNHTWFYFPRRSWSSLTNTRGIKRWVALGTTTVSKQSAQDRYVTAITAVSYISHGNWSAAATSVIPWHLGPRDTGQHWRRCYANQSRVRHAGGMARTTHRALLQTQCSPRDVVLALSAPV